MEFATGKTLERPLKSVPTVESLYSTCRPHYVSLSSPEQFRAVYLVDGAKLMIFILNFILSLSRILCKVYLEFYPEFIMNFGTVA